MSLGFFGDSVVVGLGPRAKRFRYGYEDEPKRLPSEPGIKGAHDSCSSEILDRRPQTIVLSPSSSPYLRHYLLT